MGLRAVIFDVDGVLVQSMERHAEAYQRIFAAEGVRIDPHEVYANEGRRSREVIGSLSEERGLGWDAAKLDALNKEKQRIFLSFGPLPLYPGVRELIAGIHASGKRTAMVTGTNRANVENHLAGLLSSFDAIVTADDVTHTKPHPEPYLAALTKLGLPPGEAIVIENATLGVRAAKAAGLRVIGVASTLAAHELPEADVVVARIADVRAALEAFE